MRTLYLCGAGNAEGVRLALTINEAQKRWDRVVLLDDDPSKHGQSILGVEIEGPFTTLGQADPVSSEVANLVARTTNKRQSALQKIKEYGLPFASLIDPGVDMRGVDVGKDITVYRNVVFCANATVDEGSVVFAGAVVGHGCRLGRCCVVAPGAVINARVDLGDGVYLGTNASILPDLKVGAWATIGANSAVIQDVPAGATVMGVPAEILVAPKSVEDQKGVAKAAEGLSTTRPEYKGAVTETERVLGVIWARVLKLEKIGIDDNFFDLGGTSLAAIQVSFQIQQDLKVNITLQDLFNRPTIAGLSRKIEAELVESADAARLEKLLNDIEGMSKPST